MFVNIPIFLIFVGLIAYIVLAGADFGVGFWTLTSGKRKAGGIYLSDYLRHAMGPVWEANHVWLIFILVICWTAYPVAFASISSTLVMPLLIAAIGIILRGAAYVLNGQFEATQDRWVFVDRVFAISSLLAPFALGAAIGGIASGRVPVGNATGDLLISWLNPTSMLVGILSIMTSGYLAAVYLTADASRKREQELTLAFRSRALGSGIATGIIAIAGLIVVQKDAQDIWKGLISWPGELLLGISVAAGSATILLVWRNFYNIARVSAAIAVGAIVAGWAVAQNPRFLPGLTVRQAATDNSTLIPLTISVAIGSIILFPALMLLFALFLRGQLDPTSIETSNPVRVAPCRTAHRLKLGGMAVVFFVLGSGFTVLGTGLVLELGVIFLCVSAISAFVLAGTAGE